jgi:hypothetical protein
MANPNPITDFNLTADAAVGTGWLHTQYNLIINFLLAVKTNIAAFIIDQNLRKTDSPTFKTLYLTDSKIDDVVGDVFCKFNPGTGLMSFITYAELMASINMPIVRAGTAIIQEGSNTVSFPTALPAGTIYVATATVTNGDATDQVLIDNSKNTLNSFSCYSSLAGTLYYSIIEII